MNPNQQSTEKVMQLKYGPFNQLIGNIPASHASTVDECIEYLGGELANREDDSFQHDSIVAFCIRDGIYDYDYLYITERGISDLRISLLADDARQYSSAESFAADCALSLNFIDPESTELDTTDMALIEQLQILWHVVQDPISRLVARMGMTIPQCCNRFCIPMDTMQEWISGKMPAPDYVRLMMAEAVGYLTIRNLS